MSNTVAPLPDGIGIAAIGDRRPRREPEGRPSKSPAASEAFARSTAMLQPEDAPPPPAGEPLVPAETLFATALFANALLRQPPSANEMKLRAIQGWQPPESVLRLKDKLI